MSKSLLCNRSVDTYIVPKQESPKALIEEVLAQRKPGYTYNILHTSDTELVFNYTYDDWEFEVPVVCQLVGDTYWVVTR